MHGLLQLGDGLKRNLEGLHDGSKNDTRLPDGWTLITYLD